MRMATIPMNMVAALCSPLGRRPIQPRSGWSVTATSVADAKIGAIGARTAHAEEVEAQSLDGDDVADVGLLEEVATPEAKLVARVRRDPAQAGVHEQPVLVGETLEVAGVEEDLA